MCFLCFKPFQKAVELVDGSVPPSERGPIVSNVLSPKRIVGKQLSNNILEAFATFLLLLRVVAKIRDE